MKDRRKELKKTFVVAHLAIVDDLLSELPKHYPGINLENLVPKLVELSEKHAEERAAIAVKFEETANSIVMAEALKVMKTSPGVQ